MVLYIMTKNNTIYLAKITKYADYEADTTLEMEAFTYMSDAEAFLLSNGMERNEWGNWSSKLDPWSIDGSIIELEVK